MNSTVCSCRPEFMKVESGVINGVSERVRKCGPNSPALLTSLGCSAGSVAVPSFNNSNN